MRKLYLKLFKSICFTFLFFTNTLLAQPVIGFQSVTTGLTKPVDVVNAGDSRLFIVQQNGLILIWNGTGLKTFIDLSAIITPSAGNEQGLLSLAFHPAYATNGYFFVWYTNATGAVTLARYKRSTTDPDKGDETTGQVLLSVPKPGSPYFTNHNGAKLNFGPDGMLYIGTGDGGSGGDPFNNAQNGSSYLGKMLRINVNSFATTAPYYDIPSDNPFLTPGDGILDEIYDFGVRNPFRWSFDKTTGDMWLADVGQAAWEEVNYLKAGTFSGLNFGWHCREGAHVYTATNCTGTFTEPVFEYGHDATTGGFAITGGYVYHGPDYPALTGYYVTVDYVSGNLWLLKANGTAVTSSMQNGVALKSIVGFGEGNDGTLYAIQQPSTLYKVIVTSVLPVSFINISAQHFSDHNVVRWSTATEINTGKFNVQFSTDGQTFNTIAEIASSGNNNGSSYQYSDPQNSKNKGFYRVVAVDNNGSLKYSSIVSVAGNTKDISIYPTFITNHTFNLDLPFAVNNIQIIGIDGRLIYEKNVRNQLGTVPVNLPVISKGIFIVQITGDNNYSKRMKINVQ